MRSGWRSDRKSSRNSSRRRFAWRMRRNFVTMTDQLKIDARKSAKIMSRPGSVEFSKAKTMPLEARKVDGKSIAAMRKPLLSERRPPPQSQTVKIIRLVFALALLFTAARAEDNRYDL